MFRSAGLGGLALFLCLASPAGAIVINGLNGYSGGVSWAGNSPPEYDNVDLSGVVEILLDNGTVGCSGSLLSDGFSILTAGHCVTDQYGGALPSNATVVFLGPTGKVTDAVSAYFVDPAWTGNGASGGDLAVLRLSQEAPSWATEYSLYTGAMPATGDEVMAGYGIGGTGFTGGETPFGTLRVGTNEYVEDGAAFGDSVDQVWSTGLYVGEFYDPNLAYTNALNDQVDTVDLDPYWAPDEVDISSGDSGGPSFYDGEIVGVHDLGICYTTTVIVNNVPTTECTDSTGTSNESYFGDMYADTSTAANDAWIDAQLLPEPASFVLFGLGLAILVAAKRRSSNSQKPPR